MKKDSRTYIFVGNREYVLREMLKMGLNVTTVIVMEGSYLHNRLLENKFVDYLTVSSKRQLLDILSSLNYDVLVSNGCKYILPINNMRQAVYINLHPSYLPDLKGMDPVNGACLFNRMPGATCHIIDAGIDTGLIISRVPIPLTDDVDSIVLFQMCFKAEVIAFKEAYDKGFLPLDPQPIIDDAIYYTISPSDMNLHFNKGVDFVLNQARAFGYSTKGLYFKCRGQVYKCYSVKEMNNPFLFEMAKKYQDYEVFMSVDKDILFKLNNRVLRLSQIQKSEISEHDYVEEIM